jgi:hypothetical protein
MRAEYDEIHGEGMWDRMMAEMGPTELADKVMNLQPKAEEPELLPHLVTELEGLAMGRPFSALLRYLEEEEELTYELKRIFVLAYKLGHRDARHAAAVLVTVAGA